MVSDMFKYLKSTVAAVALVGLGLMSPAMAQSASEMAVRMSQLEEQVRGLMGQIEELNFEVKQLRGQATKSGGLDVAPQVPRKLAVAAIAEPAPAATEQVPAIQESGVAEIEMAPLDAASGSNAVALNKAPEAQVLGAMSSGAAKPDDGGFQGKVLVPPSQQEPGDDAFVSQAPANANADSIETVSLSPENPEALYESSNESLLRRQFGDAEGGFSSFLQKYPDHSLAGSAQYWLGETYYAQNDYRQAAQAFLQGYK